MPPDYSTFQELLEKLLDEKFAHVDTKLNVILEQNKKRDDEHVACLAHRTSDMAGVYDRLRGMEQKDGIHDEKIQHIKNEIIDLKKKDADMQAEKAQWFQGWGQWIGAIIAAFTLGVLIYQSMGRDACSGTTAAATTKSTQTIQKQ